MKSLDWFVWKSWNLFACFGMEFVAFFLFKHESFKDILTEMLRVEGRKEGRERGIQVCATEQLFGE